MSDTGFDAFVNFLTLGVSHYAKNLTDNQCEYAVYKTLVSIATSRKQPGDTDSMGNKENDFLAKWWACVAFDTPKQTKSATSTVVLKPAKNLNNFFSWLHLCQRHREEIAKKDQHARCICCRARRTLITPVVAWRLTALAGSKQRMLPADNESHPAK